MTNVIRFSPRATPTRPTHRRGELCVTQLAPDSFVVDHWSASGDSVEILAGFYSDRDEAALVAWVLSEAMGIPLFEGDARRARQLAVLRDDGGDAA